MEQNACAIKKLYAFALTAVIFMSAFSLSAYAEKKDAVDIDTAQETALRELEVLKDMGLLSENVQFEGDADDIYESPEHIGDEYWFNRAFPHRYEVRWYSDRQSSESSYGGNICVDAATGKLSHFSIDATPGADVEPTGETEWEGQKMYFYDNFTDIFPADMTVDEFCSLLAEYWGFSGYTISDTEDEMYGKREAVKGDSLMKDMPYDNYYLTVFFEGDQENVPMYVQLCRFAGYVSLFAGTGHTVG